MRRDITHFESIEPPGIWLEHSANWQNLTVGTVHDRSDAMKRVILNGASIKNGLLSERNVSVVALAIEHRGHAGLIHKKEKQGNKFSFQRSLK